MPSSRARADCSEAMARVLKFGGSSVADAECMRRAARIATAALPARPLVVLSAMGKTTDALFRAARAAEAGSLPDALKEAVAIEQRHRAAAGELLEGKPSDALERELALEFEE